MGPSRPTHQLSYFSDQRHVERQSLTALSRVFMHEPTQHMQSGKYFAIENLKG